jgi:hypothetical protein
MIATAMNNQAIKKRSLSGTSGIRGGISEEDGIGRLSVGVIGE